MVTKATRDVIDVKNRAITDGIVIDGNCSSNFTMDGTCIGSLTPCEGTFTVLTSTDFVATGIITVTGATLVGFPFLNLAGGTMVGDLDMGGNQINDVADPTLVQDAATKGYVDTEVSSIVIPSAGPTFITPVVVGGVSGTFDCTPHVPAGTTVVIVDATINGTFPGNVVVNETGIAVFYTVATGQGQNVSAEPDPGAGQIMCPISVGLTFDFTKSGAALPQLRLVGYF